MLLLKINYLLLETIYMNMLKNMWYVTKNSSEIDDFEEVFIYGQTKKYITSITVIVWSPSV